MFHQVFICDQTPDPDSSSALIQEQSNVTQQASRQESLISENVTMGYINTTDVKMAIEELKLEKSVLHQPMVIKTDPQDSHIALESKQYLNMASSCSTVTSPPMSMIIQQPPQPATVQPLGPVYLYQPSNVILPLQPTLISMNDVMPLAVPLSGTEGISTELGQKPELGTTLKNELVPLANVSKNCKHEENIKTNIEENMKMEEESLEDDTHVEVENSVDSKVDNDAVKYQDCNGKPNSNTWHNDRQLETKAIEAIGSTHIVNDVALGRKLKTRKHHDIQITNDIDNELRSMYNIKNCMVVLNKSPSEYIIPETIQDLGMRDETEPVEEENKGSIEDLYRRDKNEPVEEENEDSSYSDKEGELTGVDDSSSGSDWEEQYLTKMKKGKNKVERTYNVRNVNLTNHSVQTNKGLSIQSKEKSNKFNAFIGSRNIENMYLTSPNLSRPSSSGICRMSTQAANVDNRLPPQNESTNDLPMNKFVYNNTVLKKTDVDHSYSFQLKLPFKTANSKMRLRFVPNNSIESILKSQNIPSKAVKIQTVTFTKIKTVSNAHRNEPNINKHVSSKTLVKTKRNNDNTTTNMTQNVNDVKRKPRPILPKVTAVPFCPRTISSEGYSNDNLNDSGDDKDDNYSMNEAALPLVPYEPYQCVNCNKTFEISDAYLYHKKYSVCCGHRRELKHQCTICGKRFTSREKRESHENSHTNARPFKCFDCEKCFNSKGARHMHHKKMHLNIKPRYLCYFCGYITPSTEHLKAHEESHRVPEGTEVPKPFKCRECDKGFISRWKLQRHQKEHQLKKCPKCPNRFKTKRLLQNHMEDVHKIVKNYDCKECGKQFRYAETLRGHRKFVHSSVISFTCAVCDKGFKRKTNLQQHMITHTDDRPISCPVCGDRFKRITHLKQHTDAVHGEGRKS